MQANMVYTARAYPGLYNMKQLGAFLSPCDGIPVLCRVTPCSILPVPNYTPG